MKFKSDKQRKAVMARLTAGNVQSGQIPMKFKNKNYKDLRKMGIKLVPNKDADKDGVVNVKDCKPLDPKRQGLLHDFNMRRLKAKEETLERKRQIAMDKLGDTRERLSAQSKVAEKKASISQAQNAEKQAVIDEINKERKVTDELKKRNMQAKRDLDKITVTGRIKTKVKNTVAVAEEKLEKKIKDKIKEKTDMIKEKRERKKALDKRISDAVEREREKLRIEGEIQKERDIVAAEREKFRRQVKRRLERKENVKKALKRTGKSLLNVAGKLFEDESPSRPRRRRRSRSKGKKGKKRKRRRSDDDDFF